MNIKQAVYLAYAKAFDYSSRASRAEYWWFILFCMIAAILISVFTVFVLFPYFESLENVVKDISICMYILVLPISIPSISLSVRRLHDINKSGWWLLMSIIPIIGIVGSCILLYWHIKPGDLSVNRYGGPSQS